MKALRNTKIPKETHGFVSLCIESDHCVDVPASLFHWRWLSGVHRQDYAFPGI